MDKNKKLKPTVREFYAIENYPIYDKYDRKSNLFTYYDLIEFAEDYAKVILQKYKDG